MDVGWRLRGYFFIANIYFILRAFLISFLLVLYIIMCVGWFGLQLKHSIIYNEFTRPSPHFTWLMQVI